MYKEMKMQSKWDEGKLKKKHGNSKEEEGKGRMKDGRINIKRWKNSDRRKWIRERKEYSHMT